MPFALAGSVVSSGLFSAVTSTSISLPSVAAGEVIAVWGWHEGGTTAYTSITVTDAGDTFTNGTPETNGQRSVGAAFALSPTAGSKTITVTFNGGSGGAYGQYFAARFTPPAGTTVALDAHGVNAGFSASPATVTASSANATADSLSVAAYSAGGTGTANAISDPPTTGWTSAGVSNNDSSNASGEAAYKINTSTVTESATWTFATTPLVSGSVAALWTVKATVAASPSFGIDDAKRNRPGRGPYSKGAYKRPAYPAYANALSPTSLSSTPGAWTWAGVTSTPIVGPQYVEPSPSRIRPGRGPYSLGPYFRRDNPNVVVTTASSGASINATPGAWTWVGVTFSSAQLINATPGVFTWAGSTASLSQVIAATPGAWTWAGSAASLTQLVSLAPGAYTWAGAAATFSQLVSATPGAYTWAGAQANLNGALNAVPGTWTWAGNPAALTQLVNATPGDFTWAGSAATTSQLLNAVPGAWQWSGAAAVLASQPLISTTPGAFSWAGVTAALQQQTLITTAAGAWTWRGVTSSLAVPSTNLPGRRTKPRASGISRPAVLSTLRRK